MTLKIETTQINTTEFNDLGKVTGVSKTQSASISVSENAAGKLSDLNLQAAQIKLTLLATGFASTLTNVANVKSAAPVAEGRPEISYDGMFVGANGRAYPNNTPLEQIPPVMPHQGTTSNQRIIYVNGITTDKKDQFDNMQVIADVTGEPIIGIHNSTEGPVKDIKQCLLDKNDVGKNPAHDTLTNTIVNELRQGHSLHIIGHSQGGLITARSLRWAETILYKQEIAKHGSMLNPFIKREAREEVQRLMGKIQVETFGAASAAYPNGPRYVHYINNADNVPTKLGLGVETKIKDAGKNAVVRHFRADFPNSKPFDKFLAPHSIDNCYMSYRVPFAQAWREGSTFMTAPVRPFRREGYAAHETP